MRAKCDRRKCAFLRVDASQLHDCEQDAQILHQEAGDVGPPYCCLSGDSKTTGDGLYSLYFCQGSERQRLFLRIRVLDNCLNVHLCGSGSVTVCYTSEHNDCCF